MTMISRDIIMMKIVILDALPQHCLYLTQIRGTEYRLRAAGSATATLFKLLFLVTVFALLPIHSLLAAAGDSSTPQGRPPVQSQPLETIQKDLPARVDPSPALKGDAQLEGIIASPETSADIPSIPPNAPSEKDRRWVRASNANSIYFAYGSPDLTESALTWIGRHAQRLTANPRLAVTLVGYTDDFSSSSYSIALGERRAQTVREQLLALNVNSSQIRVISYGHEKFPTSPCQTEICRSSYRRVEFRYVQGESTK